MDSCSERKQCNDDLSSNVFVILRSRMNIMKVPNSDGRHIYMTKLS